jgi:hypothetical protein
MTTSVHFSLYLAHFFLERKMFQTRVVEKTEKCILCSFSFLKTRRFCDNVEKYCRAGQATGDNMVHAHCVLYN